MKSLPPLNSLRAFEAAARHMSFSKAANELNVTPGAISQQIKLLESFLSLTLFRRLNRQILLTESGQILLPKLSEAFDMLGNAIQSINTYDENEPLTITAPPAFISKWLIPKLCDFNQIHPEIDVRIDSSTRVIDFEHEKMDVGIRFSLEQDKSLDSSHLLSLEVIAVCSPDLVNNEPALHQPSDLVHHTLLNYGGPMEDNTWPDWTMWLSTMEIEGVDPSHAILFNQSEMMLQAAIEGQGVALTSSVVAENDIQTGRLVQPFKHSMPIHFSYFLVSSHQNAKLKRVKAFKNWILGRANKRDSALC